ncbi:MAG: hypothetical protein VX228_10820, partial [Pseudomonadota bacterium]|nr:hypothetical protein [Pseudomonadota bacterium]
SPENSLQRVIFAILDTVSIKCGFAQSPYSNAGKAPRNRPPPHEGLQPIAESAPLDSLQILHAAVNLAQNRA